MGVDLGFTKFVIWSCLALYLATLIIDLKHITFAHPQFFFLLLLIPLFIIWQYQFKKKSQPT
ncbi:MAG: hypothetical protein ACEQSC_01755, partial [Candidatus Nanopelagicaceae bacterium]